MTTLWYIARATGFVTVVLLSASVALGIVTSMRWSAPRWPRFVTTGVHKNVSLVATTFLGVHILTSVLDPVSPVRVVNAIVPFTGPYRPLTIGLGVVAFDLLAAVIVSSVLKQHISHHTWKTIHWGAYAFWPLAMLHGLGSGTDAGSLWASSVYLASGALVLTALTWRLAAAPARRAVPLPVVPDSARAARGELHRGDAAVGRADDGWYGRVDVGARRTRA